MKFTLKCYLWMAIVVFIETVALYLLLLLFNLHFPNPSDLLWVLCFNYLFLYLLVLIGFRFFKNKLSTYNLGNPSFKTLENTSQLALNNSEQSKPIKNSTKDTSKTFEEYQREYIGNISHELKTPLFSIQGYVETLRDGGVENLAIRDKYLERIALSTDRLIGLVNDLDTIYQYEGEGIQATQFDLTKVIQEVLELLDYEASQRQATFNLNSPSSQNVVADRKKISQVLVNLISNALYYANRTHVKISITTKVINNKVQVEVEDNGMGIKPEVLPRIFERFYRVETSRNRRAGGSGLGLAIVKHLLEAHGEAIKVESTYLEGTKFSFYLDKA